MPSLSPKWAARRWHAARSTLSCRSASDIETEGFLRTCMRCSSGRGRPAARRPHCPSRRFGSANRPRSGPRRGLQGGGIVAEHRAPDDLDGRETLLHEVVVERPQAEAVALPRLDVGAQLEDLELAERVVEVRRVGRAALRLRLGGLARLVAFV